MAALALVCALAVAVTIYVLTEMPPELTSSQSGFVNALLVSLLGGVPGVYDPDTELWLGIHVRHWAHTVEFGALGLFVALSVALLRWGKPMPATAGVSVAVCMACSLADQCHKLFVPGRHFDFLDLVMDAIGYVLAVAVVVFACTVIQHCSSRASGPEDEPFTT